MAIVVGGGPDGSLASGSLHDALSHVIATLHSNQTPTINIRHNNQTPEACSIKAAQKSWT